MRLLRHIQFPNQVYVLGILFVPNTEGYTRVLVHLCSLLTGLKTYRLFMLFLHENCCYIIIDISRNKKDLSIVDYLSIFMSCKLENKIIVFPGRIEYASDNRINHCISCLCSGHHLHCIIAQRHLSYAHTSSNDFFMVLSLTVQPSETACLAYKDLFKLHHFPVCSLRCLMAPWKRVGLTCFWLTLCREFEKAKVINDFACECEGCR